MSTIRNKVDHIFQRLTVGELSKEDSVLQSGWEVSLPSGRFVTRSKLQAEARLLVALGPDAIPHLLPHVMNNNLALRYVAIYTLEKITKEKPCLSYFDQTDQDGQRAEAIEVWRRWYESKMVHD